MLLLAASCSAPRAVVSIYMNGASILYVQRPVQMTVDIKVTGGASTAVTWSVADTGVALVDDAGLVTPVRDGTTEITVTSVEDPTKFDTTIINVVSALRGVKVMYYVDSVLGADAARAALDDAAARYGTTIVTSTIENFVTTLEAENPNLVVYLRANRLGIEADVRPALLDWVANGGALVFTSWDTSNAAVQAQAAAMEAEFTHEHGFSTFEVQDPALAYGLASTTLTIIDPGWGAVGNYTMGLGALGDGVEVAHFHDSPGVVGAEAALVAGNDGRSMVLGFLADTIDAADGMILMQNIFESVLMAARWN